MSSTIKTAIRVRPFLGSQIKQGYQNTKLEVNRDRKQLVVKDEGNSKKNFKFDYLFSQDNTQEQIYQSCNIDGMIQKALEGYHSTIFAYGQTGSGKTFTMQGSETGDESVQKTRGIIPRLVKNMYHKISLLKSQRTFTIFISFLQIYNERIYDLLNPSSLNNRNVTCNNIEGLRLRWSKQEEFMVQNLFLFQCKNEEQLMKYFEMGNKNRINASHKLNVQSSRSHSILSIRVESFDPNNPTSILASRIQLVDLAGSERLSITGTEGRQAKQSIDINKSLFTLRQVINILAEKNNSKLKKEEKSYVPYRDSKLTSILKQSIGGNSYSLMIACINPNDLFFEENISTLTYATKASYIANRPVINDDPRSKTINQLKRQVKQLNSELQKANKHIQLISNLKEEGGSQQITKNIGSVNAGGQDENENDLPVPVFKKKFTQKINANYQNVSQRLIESINMVRELLKSNKQLRQKLESANRLVDQKDGQIYELTKQNQLLKQKSYRQMGDKVVELRPQLPSSQTRRSSFKASNSIKKYQAMNMANFQHPHPQINYSPEKTQMRFNNASNQIQMSNFYMTHKGIDSAPTNFNKRDINTSQEQRITYSSGKNSGEDRHASTAQAQKRGWLIKNTEPKKFLSFYEDPKSYGKEY